MLQYCALADESRQSALTRFSDMYAFVYLGDLPPGGHSAAETFSFDVYKSQLHLT
jgi:hypothetical protein